MPNDAHKSKCPLRDALRTMNESTNPSFAFTNSQIARYPFFAAIDATGARRDTPREHANLHNSRFPIRAASHARTFGEHFYGRCINSRHTREVARNARAQYGPPRYATMIPAMCSSISREIYDTCAAIQKMRISPLQQIADPRVDHEIARAKSVFLYAFQFASIEFYVHFTRPFARDGDDPVASPWDRLEQHTF